MTKAQTKQLTMIQAYIDNNMIDTAARSLSAMVRSAMSKKSQQELLSIAIKTNLVAHQEFII
jgi:hypothetical protein